MLYAQGGDWQDQIKGNERYLFPAFRKQIDRANEISDIRADAGSKRKQNGTNYSKPKQNGTNRANANEEEYNKEYKEYIEDGDERAREEALHSYEHSEIGTLISTCLKAMTPRAWEELKGYMGEMPEDLIAWAVQTSCEHGGNNWSYVSAVLRGLQSAGITTVEDAEKRSEEHRKRRNQRQQQTGKPSNVAQVNYEQREYAERKEGELPAWLREMMEEETQKCG